MGNMKAEYEIFLRKVAKDAGMDFDKEFSKKAFMNPLANDMFHNLVSGALKGLETVSIATFDFKLVAIVKLLQSWVKEKRDEIEKTKIQTQYGADAYKADAYKNYGNWGY